MATYAEQDRWKERDFLAGETLEEVKRMRVSKSANWILWVGVVFGFIWGGLMGSIALDHNPQNTYSDNPLNVFWIWFSWAVVITFLFLLVSTLIEGLIRLRRRIRKHASASDDALTKPKKTEQLSEAPKEANNMRVSKPAKYVFSVGVLFSLVWGSLMEQSSFIKQSQSAHPVPSWKIYMTVFSWVVVLVAFFFLVSALVEGAARLWRHTRVQP